jgi:hypothetical protein
MAKRDRKRIRQATVVAEYTKTGIRLNITLRLPYAKKAKG